MISGELQILLMLTLNAIEIVAFGYFFFAIKKLGGRVQQLDEIKVT